MDEYKITQQELIAKPTTLAGALEAKGVYLEKTCGGRGICGSCKCLLKMGKVHYLREPIAVFDPDTEFLPCISLPKTPTIIVKV